VIYGESGRKWRVIVIDNDRGGGGGAFLVQRSFVRSFAWRRCAIHIILDNIDKNDAAVAYDDAEMTAEFYRASFCSQFWLLRA
jgi:hypothetical protein